MPTLKDILGDSFKDGMTLDEIDAALVSKSLVDPATLPKSVEKGLFDKTASELAEAKKQLKARMTEEETEKASALEKQKTLEDAYNALKKESELAKSKSNFLGIGYDEKTAVKAAQALLDGDHGTLFECQKAFIESKVQEAKKEALFSGGKAPKSDVTPQGMDYGKRMEEAQAVGDSALMASLIRRQAESLASNTQH